MNFKVFTRSAILFSILLLTFSFCGILTTSHAQDNKSAESANAPSAAEIIKRMGDFYAAQMNLEVKATIKIYADVHDKPTLVSNDLIYAIKKPNSYNRKLIDTDSNEVAREIIANPNQSTMYFAEVSRYTESKEPVSFAKTIDENDPGQTGDLDVITFVGYLIQDNPAAEIEKKMKSIEYKGTDETDEGARFHLAGVMNGMDIELWIDAGKEPILREMKMDMTGQIRLRNVPPQTPIKALVTYTDWKLDQEIPDERFVFTPPKGVEKRESIDEIMQEAQMNMVREESRNHPLVGTPAPDFTLDLLDGGEMTLSKHKGKDIVVLDFWATWCQPCVISLPAIVKGASQFKDQNVVFYAVNKQQEKAVIKQFLSKMKLDTTVALDSTNKVSMMYGASSIPFTVIIDKNGIIKVVHKGALRDPNAVRDLIVSDIEYVMGKK